MKKKLILFAITLTLFIIPKKNMGQAPTLGTAASFVLFTSVGAVANTGPSQITGNVGSNVGLSTGFGNVDGNMHNNNATTALCAADLLIAYGQLNTTTPAFFPASPLGNGSTLTAGVYSLSGNTILSNTLTLNGQGNAGAVFIFLINGTFSSNANSVILLSNGAQACNVFWKTEGGVGLSSGTRMKGTIIANNAAISISSSVTLEGRALSTSGAVSVNSLFAYTPLGCGAPVLNGPTAPVLASTECYAVFSSNGQVTNVAGITTVTGDIGSNNGLTTGYNQLLVNGTIHPVPDPSTSQCAADLGIVYGYLNTLAADIQLLYPAQFGNNLVLTPHTYLMNGAVTLTDSLYLNAQGNANGVFVIQVNGAFSTSVNSKIILINGAQAKNVFWKVDGALSINNNSISKGTFVVNNAAILLASGVNLNGRALTTVGALSTSASTINIPPSIAFTAASGDQTVCVGSPVVFSVAATGATSYQWRKGAINIINGGSVSGATTGTLTINPVGFTDAGNNYNLVITGGCAGNYTTQNISLTVNGAPTITAAISDQTVCAGSAAIFTGSATGTGLTYQWRNGAVNLINGGNVSGANSATLVLNPVASADASSSYNLVISAACAPNYTSANAALVVNSSPTITAAISDQTVCAGSPVFFAASAPGTGLTYQWRNGAMNLMNGGNIGGANSATLSFNPVTNADASSGYNVVINGPCAPGYTSSNVSLVVNSSPTLTPTFSNQTVCAGSPATLTISATGGVAFQWRNASTNLVNGGAISGATSQTLHITPAAVTDASTNYNVVITSACGASYTTAAISLVVNSTADPVVNSDLAVCNGKPVYLTANVIAGGAYNWTGPDAFTSSAQNPVIQSAGSTNAGTYSLQITANYCASKTSTVLVTVNTCTDFYIPEGFSPNGDNINDFFVIRGINNFPQNTFVIFNRWGEKIFDASPYADTWDGKTTMGIRIGGDQLPVGTYFYVLDLGDGSKAFKGNIYLNR